MVVTHESDIAERTGRIIRFRDGILESDTAQAHVTPPTVQAETVAL